jgi:hypothetical protein
VAYDVLGDGKTLVRGGVGKVYQYQSLAILATLQQRSVIAPTLAYDTTQVTSPITTGTFPVRAGDANATACLNPVAGSVAGEAVLSPACRSFLVGLRNTVLAGGVINTTTTGPIVDGDRRMAYTWAFSAGLKREIAQSMAGSTTSATEGVTIQPSSTSTRVRDATPRDASWRCCLTRAACSAGAGEPRRSRSSTGTDDELGSVLTQSSTLLELELEKRMANRWSGRVSYTYGVRPRRRGDLDSNPGLDYGRCDRDNTHAFATSANVDLGHGLGAGMVFRTYSGYPINETTGVDSNGDGTTNDRPIKGVNDLTLPIVSALDSRGVAIRNGVDGERKTILDGRFQYVHRVGRYQAGLFLEVYNLTNHANFGNPTGARNSANFLKTIVADNPRTAQLGFRLLF